jgi:2'-5' RNA ligase
MATAEQLRFNTKTALTLVFPPLQFIQKIRKKFDKAVVKWMPRINLIFPFVEPEVFDDMVRCLQKVCAKFEPFEIDLGELGAFTRKRVTFHLSAGRRNPKHKTQA